MKKPGDESGFFCFGADKKRKALCFPFLTIHYADYQHLVLWNDDAGSPAPL